jgi:hypothetical protein
MFLHVVWNKMEVVSLGFVDKIYVLHQLLGVDGIKRSHGNSLPYIL